MATTTNFGWETPDDSDLVKDGALAMRTLGNAIDTSLVDLKGGTTGQVLSKTSNTDMDFTWVTSDDANAIQNAIVDAKGDLISATAADTPARLAVGTNGQVLTADSTTATGLKWATPSSGFTKISRSSFSGQASVSFEGVFTSDYVAYQVVFEDIQSSTTGSNIQLRLLYSTNTEQATAYYGTNVRWAASEALTQASNATEGTILVSVYNGDASSAIATISPAGNSSARTTIYGTGYSNNNFSVNLFGYTTTARTYTGLKIFASAGNISGSVAVYGLAK